MPAPRRPCSWPGAAALEPLAGGALPLICDVKGSGEDQYYRLSEERVRACGGSQQAQRLCVCVCVCRGVSRARDTPVMPPAPNPLPSASRSLPQHLRRPAPSQPRPLHAARPPPPGPPGRPVRAWLRCKLEQTLEGLRQAAPGSVAGLQPDDARAYALGFMGEYLSPRRLAQLAESAGLQPTGAAAWGAGREEHGAVCVHARVCARAGVCVCTSVRVCV